MQHQLPAKGHQAQILLFNEETVLVPFNEKELYRLLCALTRTIDNLSASGDFPEEKEYRNLHHNLMSSHFLLSPMNKVKP